MFGSVCLLASLLRPSITKSPLRFLGLSIVPRKCHHKRHEEQLHFEELVLIPGSALVVVLLPWPAKQLCKLLKAQPKTFPRWNLPREFSSVPVQRMYFLSKQTLPSVAIPLQRWVRRKPGIFSLHLTSIGWASTFFFFDHAEVLWEIGITAEAVSALDIRFHSSISKLRFAA